MFIEGAAGSGKTEFLVDKFVELITSGISTSEVLVICQNSHKKSLFVQKVREKLGEIDFAGAGGFPVYTFNGVIYHCIKDNWVAAEELIPEKLGKREIIPDLSGLGISEFFLKQSFLEINQHEEIEYTFRDYLSFKNLKHQLLRRFRLITENNLSKQELTAKSKLLGEQFAIPAERTLNQVKSYSTRWRVFDYLRQTSLFMLLLESGKIDFEGKKILLADDFDELSYSAQFFVNHIIDDMKEFYIAADADGGARRGYLCANPQGYEDLKARKNTEIIKFKRNEDFSKTAGNAQRLYNSIKTGVVEKLDTIELVDNSVRNIEMLEYFFTKIKVMLNNEKVCPDDITIVAPNLDHTLIYTLKSFFEAENIDYQLFSGSDKIMDDRIIYGAIILLQMINTNWNFLPKFGEVRVMLSGLLRIPAVSCKEILDKYKETRKLDPEIVLETDELNVKYRKIVSLIAETKENSLKLNEQIKKIFHSFIKAHLTDESSLENFNVMLESLKSFQRLALKMKNQDIIEKEWLILTKDTVVSDTPASATEIKEGCIKIATPQKVIDTELRTKYQLWLDVSSPAWFKDDTGILYNSWVFQKSWEGQEYTPRLHKQLTAEKTAAVIRKLALCAGERVFCFASQLDTSANENDGALIKYLVGRESKPEIYYKFTPREDQAPILDYQQGEMAISAVPGAGKTKILEALIIKMLTEGVNPEKILALTYMDSAARNIRDRIKESCANLSKFPYISTIHGLGLSIIKDGDNYTRLNLTSDFQICDDAARFRIMGEIYNKFIDNINIPLNGFMNDYGAGISIAKQLGISTDEAGKFLAKRNPELYSELAKFIPICNEYQAALKSKNMIDFDDILIYSVQLLKNDDIREFYREKFEFVIEDEAQDSSSIQQELLSLISKGNLIRCGDPNQAITTSFSPSDADNFKSFVKTTLASVEMVSSQRCAPDIFNLANKLVEHAEEQDLFKGAFINLQMEAVPGGNPDVKNSIKADIYPTQDDEKYRVFKEISRLKQAGKTYSTGILLRGNLAVTQWAEYLEGNGIPCICYSEAVGQKKMFRFSQRFLEVLNNPWNNVYIKDLYREFAGGNLIKTDFDSAHFLDKLGSPFIYMPEEYLPFDSLKEYRNHILNWLEKSDIPPENLINEIGDFYFKSVIDRSNIRIISIIISKFRNNYTDNQVNQVVTLNDVIEHLRELGLRKRLGGVRFFEEMEKNEHKNDFAQIMTAHKAKGLEFDVVFIPEMQEGMFYYPVTSENIEIGSRDRLINQIKQIKNKHIPVEKIKLQQIHEHLRLIYVGITRAKQYLYLSASEVSDRRWLTSKKFRPSELLDFFKSLIIVR